MKKVLSAVFVLSMFIAVSACSLTAPLAVTSNPVGTKTGESTALLLWGVVPLLNQDFGIYKAAKKGGISKISTVDVKQKAILGGLIVKYTTIVSGE